MRFLVPLMLFAGPVFASPTLAPFQGMIVGARQAPVGGAPMALAPLGGRPRLC